MSANLRKASTTFSYAARLKGMTSWGASSSRPHRQASKFRFLEAFRQAKSIPEMGQVIIDDVRRFIGKAKQNDDMCLVCVGRT